MSDLLRLSLPFLLWFNLTALCYPFSEAELDAADKPAPVIEIEPVTTELTPEKSYHIYIVLWRGQTDIDKSFISYFRQNNIPARFTICNPDSNRDKLRLIIEEIKQVKPDLVFSWGTTVTLELVGHYDLSPAELSNYITDIPVVFTLVSYPVLSKIVSDPNSSGRNVTGTSHLAPLEVQINALQQYRPFDRLGIIYNSTESNSRANAEELERQAEKMNFTLVKRKVPLDAAGKPMPEMIPRLIEELAGNVDFLYMGPDSFIAGTNKEMTTLTALWSKLPTFTSTETSVKKSFATLGLVSAYRSLGQFTAFKASEILVEGRPASTVAIETLKQFSYVINMPVALALNLPPPLSIMSYAHLEENDRLQSEADKMAYFQTHGHLPPVTSLEAVLETALQVIKAAE